MTTTLQAKFQTLQESVLKDFYTSKTTARKEETSGKEFLQSVLQHGKPIAEMALGTFGTCLYDVVSDLDFDHPETGNFLSILKANEGTYKKLNEYLQLCVLAK